MWTHTDTEGKRRKSRVRNILKSSEKTQYLMNTLYQNGLHNFSAVYTVEWNSPNFHGVLMIIPSHNYAWIMNIHDERLHYYLNETKHVPRIKWERWAEESRLSPSEHKKKLTDETVVSISIATLDQSYRSVCPSSFPKVWSTHFWCSIAVNRIWNNVL